MNLRSTSSAQNYVPCDWLSVVGIFASTTFSSELTRRAEHMMKAVYISEFLKVQLFSKRCHE
jgi:hypothetical protein